MNLYFLVEGRRTEMKIYPKWLSFLLPYHTRIRNHFDVKDNNYYIESGYGNPSLFKYIKPALENINDTKSFDYFIICLDAEENSVEAAQAEIVDFIEREKLDFGHCIPKIIVQNRCIETWLLGNQKAFSRQPEGEEFKRFIEFYDVSTNDPEMMGVFENYPTHAVFHEAYLKELLFHKNIRYSKVNPGTTAEEPYLKELQNRIQTTDHLKSFEYFINFIQSIKQNS